jgi:hypothetical protein
MHDPFSAIDAGCIDALTRLKDEQDVLDQRVKAMDEMKASVAEAVYLRVRSDYVARRNALEEQARPLRDSARNEYAKLAVILAELESAHEAIEFDRQEIELRHKLGEFDDAAHANRIAEIDARAGEKAALLEQARTLRARFVGAVRSEAELVGPTPAVAPPAAAVSAPAAPTVDAAATPPTSQPVIAANYTTSEVPMPAPVIDVTAKLPKVPADATPPPIGGTAVMPAIPPIAPPPTAAPAPPPARTGGVDATVVFRPARLVPQNPEAGKTTHPLALKTLAIGADPAADIRLTGPGIEPRHAKLEPTPKGYMLTDFDTKHGTRVNAEKIKERVLANEDVIQIGAARFVFRTG